MSSVWHRPQCNIGPEISLVTIGTMDDSRKRPGSPGLASSTRRRRANDEINVHSSMLVAMTGSSCGRSDIRHVKRHTHHARFRYQEEHQREEESSPRLGGSLRRSRRARPRLFLKASVPDASANLRKNLQIYCVSSLYATAVSSHPT